MSHFDENDEIVESINNKIKLSDSEKNVIYSQVKDRIKHTTTSQSNTSMRYKYHLALACACFLFLVLLFPTFSSFIQDSSSDQRGGQIPYQVVDVVNKYIGALEKRDIDSLVQYSHDTRHTNKRDQREHYISINDPTSGADILYIRKVKTDEYEVRVRFYDDEGTYELSFPVQKMDIGWQVVVGMDIER